jgi:hypothetical protein
MHKISHSYAGKTVIINKNISHFQNPNFGGSLFKIEDWVDRVFGKPLEDNLYNPAVIVYISRLSNKITKIKDIDNAVYGKTIDGLGHIVYISELNFKNNC